MLLHDLSFNDIEHEKAWIIRTTINACKDIVRKRAVRNLISIEDVPLPDTAEAEDNLLDKELIEALQMLPLNYRISLFLFYYEGYKVKEIAEILGKNESAVSAYLSRGRKKLKRILQEDQGGKTSIVGA
jgi:RNA polymerase sigma-70 factor (ECF subfamily)